MHRKFARYCHLFNVNQSILKTATYILYISNNWFDLFNILSNNYLSVNLFIYCFNRYIFLKYRFALLIFIHITSLLFVTPTSNRQFFISSYFIFLLHLWECVALPLRIKSALSTYLSLILWRKDFIPVVIFNKWLYLPHWLASFCWLRLAEILNVEVQMGCWHQLVSYKFISIVGSEFLNF